MPVPGSCLAAVACARGPRVPTSSVRTGEGPGLDDEAPVSRLVQLLGLCTDGQPPPSLEAAEPAVRLTQQVCVLCCHRSRYYSAAKTRRASAAGHSIACETPVRVQRLGIEALLQSSSLLEAGGLRVQDAQGSLFYDLPALTAALQQR